jgi:hypothetical protein
MAGSELFGIIEGIKNVKKLNVKKLPTQGYFYPKDFTISIKKASLDDRLLYNFNFVKDDISVILSETKRIIKNCLILDKKYKYEDIKSNDLLYIFFEIVMFTMDRDIMIPFKDVIGNTSYVPFTQNNFNYFDFDSMKCEYDSKTREFIKNDWRFSLPSLGVENCLVDYIYDLDESGERTDWNYDFLFFLGNKNYISSDEFDNLITIFNSDLDDKSREEVREIVKTIYKSIGYSLFVDGKVIDLDMKIDFETLFI